MKYKISFLYLFSLCTNIMCGQDDPKSISIAIHTHNKSGATNLCQEDETKTKEAIQQELQPDTTLTKFMIINFVKYSAAKAIIASPAGIPYLINRFMIYPFFSSQPWVDQGSEEEQKNLESKNQKKIPEIIVFPLIHHLRKKIF